MIQDRFKKFFMGITEFLMALKGINQYFSALIRLTKIKFPTLVTSNTEAYISKTLSVRKLSSNSFLFFLKHQTSILSKKYFSNALKKGVDEKH